MTWPIIFWLSVMVFCIVIEANTVTLVSTWFALGALAALITALPSGPSLFWLQAVVFAVTSAGSLALLRPVCKQYLKKRDTRTNSDRNIGEIAICTERIDNSIGQGTVKVLGKVWTARSVDGSVIEEGATVRVQAISGVKLMVLLESHPVGANR